MQNISNNSKSDQQAQNWLSIGEAAKYLRISKDTLRRWEKLKILKSYRSPTNHRYYKKEELDYVFSQKPQLEETTKVTQDKQQDTIVPTPSKNEKHNLLIIALLVVYIVLMIFLAWLLLQNN